MSKTITTSCGVQSGNDSDLASVKAIKATIEIKIPEGVSYAQMHAELAEQAMDCVRDTIRSRLDPTPSCISELTAAGKELQATKGTEFARKWIQGTLDPARYTVSDELVVSLI
jgi:hypothetical protein